MGATGHARSPSCWLGRCRRAVRVAFDVRDDGDPRRRTGGDDRCHRCGCRRLCRRVVLRRWCIPTTSTTTSRRCAIGSRSRRRSLRSSITSTSSCRSTATAGRGVGPRSSPVDATVNSPRSWPPRSRLGCPDYEVVTELDRIPVELRGLSARNPVNLPRNRGVQLELPPRVRGLSPLSPPPGDDGLSPPTRALIEALAAPSPSVGRRRACRRDRRRRRRGDRRGLRARRGARLRRTVRPWRARAGLAAVGRRPVTGRSRSRSRPGGVHDHAVTTEFHEAAVRVRRAGTVGAPGHGRIGRRARRRHAGAGPRLGGPRPSRPCVGSGDGGRRRRGPASSALHRRPCPPTGGTRSRSVPMGGIL